MCSSIMKLNLFSYKYLILEITDQCFRINLSLKEHVKNTFYLISYRFQTIMFTPKCRSTGWPGLKKECFGTPFPPLGDTNSFLHTFLSVNVLSCAMASIISVVTTNRMSKINDYFWAVRGSRTTPIIDKSVYDSNQKQTAITCIF